MSPLELWRHEQHEEDTTPNDVELMRFLGTMTGNRVRRDITAGFSRDERALYRFHRGAA